MAEGEGAGHPDAVLLAPLSEDTFLHNLHVRYKRDIIYVSSGGRATCARCGMMLTGPFVFTDVRG